MFLSRRGRCLREARSSAGLEVDRGEGMTGLLTWPVRTSEFNNARRNTKRVLHSIHIMWMKAVCVSVSHWPANAQLSYDDGTGSKA